MDDILSELADVIHRETFVSTFLDDPYHRGREDGALAAGQEIGKAIAIALYQLCPGLGKEKMENFIMDAGIEHNLE